MAVELVIGGWFASAAITKLYDLVRSYINHQYEYQTGVESKLESLEQSLGNIKMMIDAAERKGIEEDLPLVSWLNMLKDAVYDAEDILDLFEYESLRDKVKSSGKVRNVFASTSHRTINRAKTAAKRLIFSDDSLNELFRVVKKFDSLANDGRIANFLKLAKLNKDTNREDQMFELRQSTPIPAEPKVFGRSKENDQLLNLLLASSDTSGSHSDNFSVVSVVGIGGVGKTTLAQTVYGDTKVKNHFDLMAWVCISDRYSIRRVMIEIMESASRRSQQDLHNRTNLGSIQEDLIKMLEGKRFLIVLDDVWDDMATHWDKLSSTFRFGREGSRIVVTTRSQSVADSVKSKETINLEGLEDAEFWQLFTLCAFGDVNPNDHPKLEHIGQQIAKKLGRLPLAAKTVGAVLKRRLEEKHWRGVLENKSWLNKDGILPSLKLSYDHLPAYLKQCFVYCALFPKDYRFGKERLVQIWVALGYIPSSNGKKTLEDVGQEYFDELASRCFFQNLFEEYYVIHDLLHDLAESMSTEEVYRQEEDNLETLAIPIPERVRHLFVRSTNLDGVLDKIQRTKRLRSLVHDPPNTSSEATTEELKTTFRKLPGLRILILGEYYSSSQLDDAIDGMAHLRYLEFHCATKLPSLGRLYHLQVLTNVYEFSHRYCHSNWDNSWAQKLTKLINLRYINVSCFNLSSIPGIGQLTSLQRLHRYVVREEEGHKISELGSLGQIRGSLCIVGLENVANKEEAKKAGLVNKEHLDRLELVWDEERDTERHSDYEEVLEGLQPHNKLKNVEILRYMGINPPSWFNKICLYYIESIQLSECWHLKALPPLGELPFLRHLQLSQLNSLEMIGVEAYGEGGTVFPSLEDLSLDCMNELREWSALEKDGRVLMPRLRRLHIEDCKKLEVLPPLGELPVLEVLQFYGLSSLEKVGAETYGEGSIVFPMLQHLSLQYMPELSEWSAAEEHGRVLLPRLRKLKIHRCPKFKRPIPCHSLLKELKIGDVDDMSAVTRYIPASSLRSLQSLTVSRLKGVEAFTVEQQEWFQSLTSLRQLFFIDCDDLLSLPDAIGSLSSLERLVIIDCPKMVSLGESGLPACLRKLSIAVCRELEKLCDWREDGSEWNKISHVPLVKIGSQDIPRPPPTLPAPPQN